MAITRTNLRNNLYNTIYTHLNANVTDPASRTGKHWIFPSYPDTTVANFIGYPLIVINKAELDKTFETFDNTYSDVSFPLEVMAVASKASVTDALSDSIDVAMAISIDKKFTFGDYSEQCGQLSVNGDSVHYRIHKYTIEVDL